MTGIIAGVSLAFLATAVPAFNIGLPSWALAISTETLKFFTVVVLAPIFEELLFRFVILSLLTDNLPLADHLRPIVASILSAVIFTIYHSYAYGSWSSASGAFVGAFMFAMIANVLYIKTKDLLPSIEMHAIYNFAIISYKFVVVGV